jgi:2',3'-cyclic-nucleotide 2'-phosphodiesterase (5'-nucleotidase family)
MNQHVTEAFETIGMDAANLSYLDLPAFETLPLPDFAVSANVKSEKPVPTHLLIEKDDLTIAVTGITKQDQSFAPSPSFRIEDPVEAAVTVLSALRSEADVLILLAYDAADAAQAIVEAIPELDVVVDTRQNRQHAPPLRIGNTLWVRSHYQTMRLGELRLNTTTQGDVELVVDRKIDLDNAISSEPTMLRQMQQAREELNAIQSKLFGLVE